MSYTLNGEQYANYFPHYFAENHTSGTGPDECYDCYYGRIHGIFMGYCTNCAVKYKGYRGPGMDKNLTNEQQINDNRLFFIKKVKITKPENNWLQTIFWIFLLFTIYFLL